MKAVIYAIPIPSPYIHLENTKHINKILPNPFPCCLQLWMYHTPLLWYEEENLGYKSHFEALPMALWFLRLYTL